MTPSAAAATRTSASTTERLRTTNQRGTTLLIMRALLCACLLPGCSLYYGDDDPSADTRADAGSTSPRPDAYQAPPYVPDGAMPASDAGVPVWTPACVSDADCGPNVCSAIGTCLPENQVRDVTATWTYDDYPASTYTCTTANATAVEFFFDRDSLQPHLGPVACPVGTYVIKNVPLAIQYVYTGVPGVAYDDSDYYCWDQPAKHWVDPYGEMTFDMRWFDTWEYCGL